MNKIGIFKINHSGIKYLFISKRPLAEYIDYENEKIKDYSMHYYEGKGINNNKYLNIIL